MASTAPPSLLTVNGASQKAKGADADAADGATGATIKVELTDSVSAK